MMMDSIYNFNIWRPNLFQCRLYATLGVNQIWAKRKDLSTSFLKKESKKKEERKLADFVKKEDRSKFFKKEISIQCVSK